MTKLEAYQKIYQPGVILNSRVLTVKGKAAKSNIDVIIRVFNVKGAGNEMRSIYDNDMAVVMKTNKLAQKVKAEANKNGALDAFMEKVKSTLAEKFPVGGDMIQADLTPYQEQFSAELVTLLPSAEEFTTAVQMMIDSGEL